MVRAEQTAGTEIGPGTLIRRAGHIAAVMTRHGLSDFFGKEAAASGSHEAVRERAIKFRDGQVLDRWQSFIRPTQPIPYKVSALTGITWAQVQRAPVEHKRDAGGSSSAGPAKRSPGR